MTLLSEDVTRMAGLQRPHIPLIPVPEDVIIPESLVRILSRADCQDSFDWEWTFRELLTTWVGEEEAD